MKGPGFQRVGGPPSLNSPAFIARQEDPAQRQIRILGELQTKGSDGHFVGGIVWDEISSPEGSTQAVVHFGNPYAPEGERFIKTLTTTLTRDQLNQMRDSTIWTKECCQMLLACAEAFELRRPLILQGESSIGKSFCIDEFCQLVFGLGQTPITFDCTGQTDIGDLSAKVTANTGAKAGDSPFKVQWGAIPRAQTYTRSATGEVSYPEQGGTGKPLHIQEVSMAKPAVINILMALRGNGRRVAKRFTVQEDGGKEVPSGPNFWVVMSANPFDKAGFQDRFPLDKALVRGCALVRMGDLCEESWKLSAEKILGWKIGKVPSQSMGIVFEYHKDPTLVKILAEALGQFHLEYKAALKADPDESEAEEKVMASSDDMSEVAGKLLTSPLLKGGKAQIDMVETFRRAVKSTYLERHLWPESADDIDTCFRTRMEKLLDSLLDSDETGSIKYKGRIMTRAKAIAAATENASAPVADRLKQAKAALKQAQAGVPDDLGDVLG